MPVQVRPPAFKMKTDLLVIRERFFLNYAGMAELADAPDLGSGVHDVQVQVLLPALNGAKPNPVYFFKKVFAVVVNFARR